MKREAVYSKCILTWFFHFTLNCTIIIAVRRAVWYLSIHEVLRCSSWSFKSPIRHLQISSRDIRDLSSASAVYWDDVHQQTCGKKKKKWQQKDVHMIPLFSFLSLYILDSFPRLLSSRLSPSHLSCERRRRGRDTRREDSRQQAFYDLCQMSVTVFMTTIFTFNSNHNVA